MVQRECERKRDASRWQVLPSSACLCVQTSAAKDRCIFTASSRQWSPDTLGKHLISCASSWMLPQTTKVGSKTEATPDAKASALATRAVLSISDFNSYISQPHTSLDIATHYFYAQESPFHASNQWYANQQTAVTAVCIPVFASHLTLRTPLCLDFIRVNNTIS